MKVIKMVLNSYFLRNKADHIFKDIDRWRKKDLSFHILYVNVLTIAREESKIPQITLCLLLSILKLSFLHRNSKFFLKGIPS